MLAALTWIWPLASANVPQAVVVNGLPGASFIENRGQWSIAAAYVGRCGTSIMSVEQDSLLLEDFRSGDRVRLRFEGANPDARIYGMEASGALASFFRGADPAGWHAEVPMCASVIYEGLYPGIDLRLYGRNKSFEMDVIVHPQADLAPFIVHYEGAQAGCIATEGALVLETEHTAVRQPSPITWQVTASGEHERLAAGYRLLPGNRYGLVVEGRDPSLCLVVDPGLVWSTFLGGVGLEAVTHVAVAEQGQVVVAGYTRSPDFPISPEAYDSKLKGAMTGPSFSADVFVSQFDSSGNLLHSTFLGGHHLDVPYGLAVRPDGRIIVAGRTLSQDFPTTPGAFDTTLSVYGGGFVAQLDSTGSQLLFSTVLDGNGLVAPEAMDVDSAGTITLVGYTTAVDFPITQGAFDTVWDDPPLAYEGFVTKFAPDGDALVFSTFLGGTNQDYAKAVAVDDSGAVTVAGVTGSSDFPITPGAFDSQVDPFGGNRQYVARLDPTGSSLLFSTYFGGLELGPEEITDIEVDITGATTLAGYTDKADFPVTPGVHDPFLYDAYDAFVSRLDPTGSALIFSTLFGFGSSDEAYALVLDSAGAPTIVGTSWSEDMPTTPGTFQAEKTGPWPDGFLARFSPDASELLYSTYLGGSDKEWEGYLGFEGDLALAPDGEIYTVGTTRSADFPTALGAFDTTYGGDGDGFIARFDMLPAGIVKYGSASAACQGPIAIGALKKPQANALLLTSTNGPPLGQGFLVVGASAEVSGIPLFGANLHVSPFEPIAALSLQANELGYASLQLSFPPLSGAARGFVQFLWLGTPSCGGLGSLSSSNGLALALPL